MFNININVSNISSNNINISLFNQINKARVRAEEADPFNYGNQLELEMDLELVFDEIAQEDLAEEEDILVLEEKWEISEEEEIFEEGWNFVETIFFQGVLKAPEQDQTILHKVARIRGEYATLSKFFSLRF